MVEPERLRAPRRRFASLDTFVEGMSNRIAATSAHAIVEQLGRVSPLVFFGPPGVGKTHLLEGIWTAAHAASSRANAVYLSAEQFTSYYLEALHGSGLPNFRRKYRGVDLLLVDDVQFFASKRATLVELLHTIDTLQREGRQVVLACDRPPAEMEDLGPELVTRLSAGLVCRIDPPEYETRLGIVRRLAARLEFALPGEVQTFVAANINASARELSGAVNRLHATSRALRQPITLAVAEETLAEAIRHSAKTVRLADIQRAVCNVFGLEPQSLVSTRKGKHVSQPRMLAMWLARKHTRAGLSEIGHFFGRRSHSTVISAQKKIGLWIESNAPLELPDCAWRVEDAIRRVEERLLAG
jgi:chromosomal replication initiator protein